MLAGFQTDRSDANHLLGCQTSVLRTKHENFSEAQTDLISERIYYTRHRQQWLNKIQEPGVRRRAERLYQQLDMLQLLRQQARRELLAESRKHTITAKLRTIPSIGPIRSALAVALIQPIAFARSASCGPIADWGSRPATAGNTTMSKGKCDGAKSKSSFAV
jgi:transposase